MSPCHHIYNVLGKCIKCGQTQLPGDTVIGRDGVRINKHPRISASGTLHWNVRDILFKPTTSDAKGDAVPFPVCTLSAHSLEKLSIQAVSSPCQGDALPLS